jgi:copper chaperone CopZ
MGAAPCLNCKNNVNKQLELIGGRNRTLAEEVLVNILIQPLDGKIRAWEGETARKV